MAHDLFWDEKGILNYRQGFADNLKQKTMPNRDIIVIGTSAGGVEALREVAHGLPPDLAAAVFIVIHLPATSSSVLPDILSRNGPLPAFHAIDGEDIRRGRIYIAPPDYHLMVERDHMRVVRCPKENRMRPAADPLFRSAARAFGPRVIGLVLTGTLDDGTAGLLAVKRRGGVTVAQDPIDALYPGMPRSALNNVIVDYCLPLSEIPPLLARLTETPAPDEDNYPASEELKIETGITLAESGYMESVDKLGNPSIFTCPECSGVLWEMRDGELIRFRCHVGHAFSVESLLADQSEALENALWAALRALEERAALCHRMVEHSRRHNQTFSARRFEENARELERHGEILRGVLQEGINNHMEE